MRTKYWEDRELSVKYEGVRTVRMLLEFQKRLCGRDWPSWSPNLFLLFMIPMTRRFPVSHVVRSASERVLTYRWDQRGYVCLLVCSVFLSKSACFMHTSMMSWKLHIEDHTGDDRSTDGRNLGPYITTCVIGKNKSDSILDLFLLL